MNIQFTDRAVDYIRTKAGNEPFQVRLVYDIDDCGCAVNGVPMLWLENYTPLLETDELVESGTPFPLVCDRMRSVFFEESMKVDFPPERQSFVLDSDNQIYSVSMQLVEKRMA